MSVAALLLSDSRFPAGGHAHSGGVEPAVTAGTVSDLASLETFLRGRLRTAGLVAAGLAAARARAPWRVRCGAADGWAAPGGRERGRMGGINGPFDTTVLISGIRLTPRRMRARRRPRSGRRRGGRGGRCCARPGWRGRMTTAWPALAASVPRAVGRGAALARPGAVERGVPGRAASCGCAWGGRGGGRVRCAGRGADRRLPVGGRGRPARRCGCWPLIRCGPPPCWPGSPATSTRSPSAPPRPRTARSTSCPVRPLRPSTCWPKRISERR